MAAVATLWTSSNTSGTIAHLVAAQSGLAITPRFLSLRQGEHKQPEYLAINPKGEVPALQLVDGTVITETPAILLWIADQAPDAGLLPAAHPARAQAWEWVSWCHFQLARSFQMAFQAKRILPDDEAASGALRAAGLQRCRAAFDYAETAVQADGTLLGTGKPGAADIFLALMVRFAAFLEIDLANHPGLNRLAALVAAQPAIAAAMALEARS